MIPYLILMFLPLLGSVVMFSQCDGKRTLALGCTRRILKRSCMLPLFFLILTVLLSVKDISIGNDTANYRYYFRDIRLLDFDELQRVELDFLYTLLNWLIGRFTDDFQLFLTIISIITIFPIAHLYCQDREHGFLKIVLFMNMSIFVMLFSGLRQSISMAVGLIAYEYVKRKRLILFLICTFVALGFHHSAIIILVYFPLYHISLKKKHLWFIIPCLLLVFIFNKPIFSSATSFFSILFGDKYDAEIDSTGAYTMLLVFAAFAVFSYVFPSEKQMDQETLGMRNYMLFAVVLQCFAPVHALAMRMNYYFIVFVPILIPKILKYAKGYSKNVVLMVKIGITLFFAAYYLLTTYRSCQTGISALNTYPYVPFWN